MTKLSLGGSDLLRVLATVAAAFLVPIVAILFALWHLPGYLAIGHAGGARRRSVVHRTGTHEGQGGAAR